MDCRQRDETGFTICPSCGKHFWPVLGERKTNECIQVEFPNAKSWQREQLVTGICSQKCYNKYTGGLRK